MLPDCPHTPETKLRLASRGSLWFSWRPMVSALVLGVLTCWLNLYAQPLALDDTMHHLRQGDPREWSDFPETPDAASLEVAFDAKVNDSPWTLVLRQQDVKEAWAVSLNGVNLGQLQRDENDTLWYAEVPTGALQAGKNTLGVAQVPGIRRKPDDIRVGQVVLHQQAPGQVFSEAALAVSIRDGGSGEALPTRITIVRSDGALPVLGTKSGGPLAVRPGVVYTATGEAKVLLPAGEYTVYAGRGFEYTLASKSVSVAKGAMAQVDLAIRREVPTEGYVACDTHIHTLTHSGHGDCSTDERMITLVGEGIELPIATDHNKHIDYEAPARAAKVRKYFTPVIGNEVTTRLGHFNIFPVAAGAPVPDWKGMSWGPIFSAIKSTPGVQAIILNHARDFHHSRPFGPKMYNEAVGSNVDGWELQANAMEILNSGATQTDLLELTRDWMTQLNHGNRMTPVGCSDSHNVNTFIVGQGRTYIRVVDTDPGAIDVATASKNFVDGQVLVSYGLLTELTVGGMHSGQLARPKTDQRAVAVDIRVLGPHWVEADTVQLYVNGELYREESIKRNALGGPGVIWSGHWKVAVPRHDVHLVAVATGPGIEAPYWRMARPYQPTSPDFETRTFGCSGAVWLDGDGDGKRSSARDYAAKVLKDSDGDFGELCDRLRNFDVATAIQAAYLYAESGGAVDEAVLAKAGPHVREGFRRYREAAEESERARTED